MNTPYERERAALANDLAAIYIAHYASPSRMGDHLAGVAAILLAIACGVGPFLLLYCLDKWGPL
jgi:hypothetical protein